ncbi:hypothetical protein ES708_26551 [subsurface metagenome]
MTNRADWKAWNEERKRFLELESQGFESDIASLERHISKLQEVAPKDQAGWMNSHALDALDRLKADLTKAKVWGGMM